MTRKLILDIDEKYDAAAAKQGDGTFTVEQAIQDRLDALVRSAEDIAVFEDEVKLKGLPAEDKTAIVEAKAQKVIEVRALIDAAVARIAAEKLAEAQAAEVPVVDLGPASI